MILPEPERTGGAVGVRRPNQTQPWVGFDHLGCCSLNIWGCFGANKHPWDEKRIKRVGSNISQLWGLSSAKIIMLLGHFHKRLRPNA